MDREQRQHLEILLQTYQQHLRKREQQVAAFGLDAPPYMLIDIEEIQKKIANVEAQLAGVKKPSSTSPELEEHLAYSHLLWSRRFVVIVVAAVLIIAVALIIRLMVQNSSNSLSTTPSTIAVAATSIPPATTIAVAATSIPPAILKLSAAMLCLNAGHVARVTDAENNVTTCQYDHLNRLIAVTDAQSATTTYTYDPVGNLTSVTDALGHTTLYAYDAAGNLIAVTDPSGNVTKYDGRP